MVHLEGKLVVLYLEKTISSLGYLFRPFSSSEIEQVPYLNSTFFPSKS